MTIQRLSIVFAALGLGLIGLSAQPTPQPGVQPPVVVYPSSGMTGSGTVTAAQGLFPDGTAALPSIAFSSQIGMGFYRPSANTIAIGNTAATGGIPLAFSQGISIGSPGTIVWSSTTSALGTGGTQLGSTSAKLWQIGDSQASGSGIEVNVSPATLGTCTGGTITTGSHSAAGGYTGNTSSSCIVNFATNWTNAPFCLAMSIASTTHPRVSATAVGSITITGGVSGEAITYLCTGRIGT